MGVRPCIRNYFIWSWRSLRHSLRPSAAAAENKVDLKVGDTAPGLTLKPLNGEATKLKIVSLEDYVGPEQVEAKKALLVAYNGAPTGPSKDSMAFFKALYNEYKSKGLFVIVVDAPHDDPENKSAAAAAAFDFPVLLDRFGVVRERYDVGSKTSAVFLIDENQKLAKVDPAFSDANFADLHRAIKQLLGIDESEAVPAPLQPFMTPAPVATETEPADAAPDTAQGKKKHGRAKKSVAAAPADKGAKRASHKSTP